MWFIKMIADFSYFLLPSCIFYFKPFYLSSTHILPLLCLIYITFKTHWQSYKYNPNVFFLLTRTKTGFWAVGTMSYSIVDNQTPGRCTKSPSPGLSQTVCDVFCTMICLVVTCIPSLVQYYKAIVDSVLCWGRQFKHTLMIIALLK